MASYYIIGGDKKEYGPISGEDIRQWIAEGRLNAVTEAKAENETEWGLLGAFPEFADLLGKAPPPNIGPVKTTVSGVPSMDYVDRDYELDLGGCITKGWELVKNNLGVLFVAGLIYIGIEFGASLFRSIPFLGSLVSIANFVIAGPLVGGVYYLSIRVIRGEPAKAGDVFAGFSRSFGQLFLSTLVQALIAGVCLLPFIIVLFVKAAPLMGHLQEIQAQLKNGTPPDAEVIGIIKSIMFTGLPVLLVCMIPVTYLGVSWKFSLPLILDKQMDFWTAMKTSWKMVNMHWWQVFGVIILIALLNLAGFLACCIGLLFTLPVGYAALMYAYETIFGARKK